MVYQWAVSAKFHVKAFVDFDTGFRVIAHALPGMTAGKNDDFLIPLIPFIPVKSFCAAFTWIKCLALSPRHRVAVSRG